MSALGRIIGAATSAKYRAFVDDARRPETAQARVWAEICDEIRDAPFWRGRLIGARPPLAAFGVTDYETYRGAIDASLATGTSRLSGKPVEFWAESAGTSSVPKRFPMTALHRAQFQRTTAPLLHVLARRYPRLFSAKVVYFAATISPQRSPSGLEIGFISSFNYRRVPAPLRALYALPLEVFASHATFTELAPVYALARDLSGMIAVTPGQVRLFADSIAARPQELLGLLAGSRTLPAGFPPVRASRARIARLERALAKRPFSFREVWPSLSVVVTWTSATCGMQLSALAPYLDGVPTHDATYSATEGWMNVPLGEGVGGPLHPGAHVFEFLEVGREARGDLLLPLWALDAGKDYEIFLTTAMGMIRYRLYDVVRCSGHFERSPIVHFVQKAGAQISLGLVQIAESELVGALADARFEPRGAWFFAPNRSGDGLVFYDDGSNGDAASVIPRVHTALRARNTYYDAYAEKALVRPLLHHALPGAHPAWQRSAHAQSKPRILAQTCPESLTGSR